VGAVPLAEADRMERHAMEFGIFDHVDRSDLPLPDYYEARLQMIELYDRSGFYGYHVAEHHATPLGMSPSPSVYLSAVAQRSQRLRFGPLVYLLPFYHPLRLLEEICMLDQMSRGRLEFGLGRGISPIEATYYGLDPKQAQAQFDEAFEIIRRGLVSERLTFHGDYYQFDDVPLMMTTVQQPHPPLWYGLHTPESAERAAARGYNMVSLDGIELARPTGERFRAVWDETQRDAPDPKIGLCRFIVLSETDAAALELAERAYTRWNQNFNYLFHLKNVEPAFGKRPGYAEALADGRLVAGRPETVVRMLREQLDGTPYNYLIGQFVFGDMSLRESQSSVQLFIDRVMPALQRAAART
jgi:alkanesulfonate monooxygenase SsuD/methylene tetrahydromethanopterin reductase-like flavin-dependent oxidoreductase (luciferase family)